MSENETQLSENHTPEEAPAAAQDAPAAAQHSASAAAEPTPVSNDDAEPLSNDADAAQRDEPAAEGATDEGDIAADYLEELLDIVDLDGDIDIEVRGGRTYVSIVTEEDGEELDDLVGDRGEVLDALQELTRLAVLTATGERTRLILDIAGHRDQRQEELKDQAENAIAKVKDRGEDEHLEPMSAYERKIVHDFVAESGLISESEGEGKRRHVVISPA
ncbi:Jag family protein [Nesterenkonia sandarakina]|uniref:SpoIIIJ-associated protein n=1 Tax=Nesterenkonia sandarakina TaxID=272918 RepID=A0A2T0YN99_9MICC|nr:R3H domain-containing nucleic acid-binding protein [Nesterenkonia sandarakina]PRZ16825.1 spoIIIJ-associated protein [Nesterenkonia sandarakina]